MTQTKLTSAGRLVTETRRIRAAFSKNATIFNYIPSLFGADEVHWSKGLVAYFKLIDRVEDDLDHVAEGRRKKFEDTLAVFRDALNVDKFHVGGVQIRDTYFTELNIERIEAIDDLLCQAGRSLSLDQERAGVVASELEQLLDDIQSGPTSEIDDFLIEKLEELRFILKRYELFGPEGVRDAISTILGTITLESVVRGGLSDAAQAQVKGVWRIAKGALDALVYANSGVDAIEWAGTGLAGISEI